MVGEVDNGRLARDAAELVEAAWGCVREARRARLLLGAILATVIAGVLLQVGALLQALLGNRS